MGCTASLPMEPTGEGHSDGDKQQVRCPVFHARFGVPAFVTLPGGASSRLGTRAVHVFFFFLV